MLHLAMKRTILVAAVLGMQSSLSTYGQDRAVVHTPVASAEKYDFTPDLVYGHKDGLAMTLDVYRPKSNARGVGLLLMVSGGWVSRWSPHEQLVKLFQPVLDAGFTVFAVRHGSSPRYLIPEIADDVRLALRYVSEHAKENGVDPQRLGVFGFSAGGHLSLLLGTQTNGAERASNDAVSPRVAAVVAVFPPTDLAPYVEPSNPLRERFPALKFDPSRAPEFSPLMHVSADDAPTLLVHGDKDELVPIWHSQKIHAAFGKVSVPSELLTIEGAAHGFDAEGNKRMMTAMVQWFEKHLSN